MRGMTQNYYEQSDLIAMKSFETKQCLTPTGRSNSDFIALKAFQTKTCTPSSVCEIQRASVATEVYKPKTCDILSTVSRNVLPSQDRRWNLGSSTAAFNEIYAKRVYVDSNTLTIGNIDISVEDGNLNLGDHVVVGTIDLKNTLSGLTSTLNSGILGQVLVSGTNGVPSWQYFSGNGTAAPALFNTFSIEHNSAVLNPINIFNPILFVPPTPTSTYMFSGSMVVNNNGPVLINCFFSFGIQLGGLINVIDAYNMVDKKFCNELVDITSFVTKASVPPNTSVSISWNYIFNPGSIPLVEGEELGAFTTGLVVMTSGSGGFKEMSQINIVQLSE